MAKLILSKNMVAMNKEYALRSTFLFVVQIVGLVGPALVLIWQLLMIRPATARLVPRFLAPWNADKKELRAKYLQSVLVERGCFAHVLSRFDDNDFQHFNALLSNSSASVGVLDPDSKTSLHPSRYLRTILTNKCSDSPADVSGRERGGSEGATISV